MQTRLNVVPPPVPQVPPPTSRIPFGPLWAVPLVFNLLYVVSIDLFYHNTARWLAHPFGEILVLVGVTLLYSLVWFGASYLASLFLGEHVPVGVLRLITWIPGLNRHGVVRMPKRPDTPKEVWGRFAALFTVALAFELIFLIVVFQVGDLKPNVISDHPFVIARDTLIVGLLLSVLLAPAAPFFLSRLNVRITDSLEFPFLWLALILLAAGGSTVLALQVLPSVVFDPTLFATSIFLYAPAAWYVALAFSLAEGPSQAAFVRGAWKARSRTIHFGTLRIIDDPEGTVTDV